MSDQVNTKALDKIRKLLAKANDPSVSQAEMETFLAAASRLSLKYNIDSASVELNMSDIGEDSVLSKKSGREDSNYEINLLHIIAKNYNCRLVINKYGDLNTKTDKWTRRFTIYGTKTDVAVVLETFKICSEKFRSFAWIRYKEYQKTRRDQLRKLLDWPKASVYQLEKERHMIMPALWCKSYLSGTILGIRQKFQEEKEAELLKPEDKEKWGLIIVEKDALTDAYIKEKVGKLGTMKQRSSRQNSSAMNEGIKDGKANHQHKQLN